MMTGGNTGVAGGMTYTKYSVIKYKQGNNYRDGIKYATYSTKTSEDSNIYGAKYYDDQGDEIFLISKNGELYLPEQRRDYLSEHWPVLVVVALVVGGIIIIRKLKKK